MICCYALAIFSLIACLQPRVFRAFRTLSVIVVFYGIWLRSRCRQQGNIEHGNKALIFGLMGGWASTWVMGVYFVFPIIVCILVSLRLFIV